MRPARFCLPLRLLTILILATLTGTVTADDARIADAELRARLNSFSRGGAGGATLSAPRATDQRGNARAAGEPWTPPTFARPPSSASPVPHRGSAASASSLHQTTVSSGPQRTSAPAARPNARTRTDAGVQPVSFQTADREALQPVSAADQLQPGPEPPFLDLDAEESVDAAASTELTSDTQLIVRFIGGTVLVLGLCVAVIFGIRRWQQKHGLLPPTSGPSRVLETVVIGNRQTISLVQLQGLQAVVGCDASGIKSIVLAPPTFEDVLPTTDQEHPPAEMDTARLSESQFVPDP